MATDPIPVNVVMMVISKVLPALLALALLPIFPATAQEKLKFTFHGICWATNASGKFVSTPVNNKTLLLQDYPRWSGVTNVDVKTPALAYHVNGDGRGDVIEVINATNGATVFPLFGMFFSTDFGRLALTNADDTKVIRVDYVYGHQINHSSGDSFTTVRRVLDSHGNLKSTIIEGQMDYLILPDATHGLKVCTGTFSASKPVSVTATNAP